MRITWNELTVAFDPNKSDALLEAWRWLVGDDVQLVVVSALGDLFLRESKDLWRAKLLRVTIVTDPRS
jgi:hypothetical protein